MPNGLGDRFSKVYRRLDRLTGGALGIIRDAFRRFGAGGGAQAAAGMAYYTVFSLFPLLLALIAGGTYVLNLDQASVRTRVLNLISQAIPVSRDLIARNIQQVLQARGAVGIIGLVGALWSGSGVFTILSTHINRAWPESERRGFIKQRLVAFGMVGTLAVLLVLSGLASAALGLLPEFHIPVLQRFLSDAALWRIVTSVVPWLLIMALFLGLYRWVPEAKVPWASALWSALVASVFWELAAKGFSFYVRSGLANYDVVYGSLGAVVALMFWAYLASWIAIFGAYLGVAIAHRQGAEEV
jgi:membrane protein